MSECKLRRYFPIPGQCLEDWQEYLDQAVRLQPEHLSTYCLTLEEDTALFLKLSRGEVQRDSDRDTAFYEATWDLLEQAGFEQYEISNFSRPNYTCCYNLNVWSMGEWLGLGPAAASQLNHGRFARPACLQQWIQEIEPWPPQSARPLPEAVLAADALIFGLRMNRGGKLDAVARRFPIVKQAPLAPLFALLETEGLIEQAAPYLRLTRKGRLLADVLAVEILILF